MNLLDLVQQKASGEFRKVGNKDGGEYHGPCPMCGGEDRFHVWPEQNPDNEVPGSFWCRQCGKGGDVITFVMAADGVEYPEALKRLGIQREFKRAAAPRPPAEKKREEQMPEARPVSAEDPARWREMAGRFVKWSMEKLQGNSGRLAWLKKRGIRQDTCRRFKLGFNPGQDGKDIHRPRESWGLKTKWKKERKTRLWLPCGMVIPLLEPMRGGVERVRIRTAQARDRSFTAPKYYVVPGSSMDMLAIPAAVTRAVVVVEAELDAILIWQEAGDVTGVVAIGTSRARPDPKAMDVLARAELIIHAMDYDDAGAEGLEWWQQHFDCVERWPVPAGKDPGEAYSAGVDIRGWVMDALPPTWRKGKVQGSRFKVQGSKKSSVGPLVEKDQKGEARSEKQGPGVVGQVSGGGGEKVRELVDLLMKSPVVIRHTEKETAIDEPEGWKTTYEERSRRISQLVFTEEVMEWLDGVGLEVVGRKQLNERGYHAG